MVSTEDWIEMPSLLAAAKLTGVNKGNLSSALRATRKHAGGWEVKSDTVHLWSVWQGKSPTPGVPASLHMLESAVPGHYRSGCKWSEEYLAVPFR